MLVCEVQELFCERCKPGQNIPLSRSSRPALPVTLLLVEWIIPFLALVEHGLYRRTETCNFSEEGVEKTRYSDVHLPQPLLQHVVNVLAVFG